MSGLAAADGTSLTALPADQPVAMPPRTISTIPVREVPKVITYAAGFHQSRITSAARGGVVVVERTLANGDVELGTFEYELFRVFRPAGKLVDMVQPPEFCSWARDALYSHHDPGFNLDRACPATCLQAHRGTARYEQTYRPTRHSGRVEPRLPAGGLIVAFKAQVGFSAKFPQFFQASPMDGAHNVSNGPG